jgi:hypothetical protein
MFPLSVESSVGCAKSAGGLSAHWTAAARMIV